MRFVALLILAFLIIGCSSGSTQDPVTPASQADARLGFSNPYTENGQDYVDISVENVSSLYQFSLRVEFNPTCIEFQAFEPSRDFSTEPIMLSERIKDIPAALKSDLQDPSNSLVAITVSRPYPHLGDIERPRILGRIMFKNRCWSNDVPFSILNQPDFIVFRDHNRKRIDINPVDPTTSKDGDQ